MIPTRRQAAKYLAKIFDLCILTAVFVFTAIVLDPHTSGMTLAECMAIRIQLGSCLLFALLLGAWHRIFILCGLYVSKRLTSRRAETIEVCTATSLASAFLLLSATAFHIHTITLRFVVLFCALSTCLMVSGRLLARSLLSILRRRGRNRRFVLIFGTNQRAMDFASQITGHPELGYDIAGFVDDDWDGITAFEKAGNTRRCTFSDLADLLRHHVVDEAAIYLPLRSYYQHAAELVNLCEQHGIAIRFDSQIFNFRSSHPHVPDWDATSQVRVAGPARVGPGVIKRVLDYVFSGILLVLFAPLFVIVASSSNAHPPVQSSSARCASA